VISSAPPSRASRMTAFLRRIPLLLGLLLFTGVVACSSPPPGPRLPAATPKSKPASVLAPKPSKTAAPSASAGKPTPVSPVATPARPAAAPAPYPVMLGIDTLAADGFRDIAGQRVGLLTHAAGVNRFGVSTVDVLRKAPNVKLVALFSPEHGLYSLEKASVNIADTRDSRTGLPVYSLHGANRKPTRAQLKNLDALVIDLQDIGVRSYTYNVVMRYAMDACFAAGVRVVVLDRPNPLGGLKVDGPHLDREHMSGVGAFRIPYVHGLTIGELARIAANAPGVLDVPESVRAKGRLTVIPMRGWKRSMQWPDTGLKFTPTSPLVQDYAAVVGYAMTGLGCEYSGFRHGAGREFPFRAISFKGKTPDQLAADLTALRIPGLAYRKVTVPDAQGRPATALYVDIADWNAWNPTELSFELMRLACRYDPPNPFARLGSKEVRSFNIHTGSTAWWQALVRDGAKVNLDAFQADWKRRAAVYQNLTRRYWLYQ
jgi:uncharacterized protein YbbC (DUF1343 family)